jgi:hypothetical protein
MPRNVKLRGVRVEYDKPRALTAKSNTSPPKERERCHGAAVKLLRF